MLTRATSRSRPGLGTKPNEECAAKQRWSIRRMRTFRIGEVPALRNEKEKNNELEVPALRNEKRHE
ncbi:MAG: hypothetical protein E7277_04500 [Lachnospiraceae bacterium]|nr:hypothetical protein [Lachnospiraceae bacterium]